MTRLELIRSLYDTGLVLQLGHKRRWGIYPLRWLGRKMLRRCIIQQRYSSRTVKSIIKGGK